jgi:hypothetical protein
VVAPTVWTPTTWQASDHALRHDETVVEDVMCRTPFARRKNNVLLIRCRYGSRIAVGFEWTELSADEFPSVLLRCWF